MTLQQRKSNIELLRIIAMGMIVIYHIFIHGIAPTEIVPQTILSILYNTSVNFYRKIKS